MSSAQSRLAVPWRFVLKWAAATALGFTTGQILGSLIGSMAGGLVLSVVGQVGATVIAIALVGASVGITLGLAQRLTVPDEISSIKYWALSSALGWAVGLTLAQLISWIGEVAQSDVLIGVPPLLVVGIAVGIVQWLAVRRAVQRSSLWIVSNAIGWMAGLPVAAILLQVTGSLAASLGDSGVYLIAELLSGAVAGLVTGVTLGLLQQNPGPDPGGG